MTRTCHLISAGEQIRVHFHLLALTCTKQTLAARTPILDERALDTQDNHACCRHLGKTCITKSTHSKTARSYDFLTWSRLLAHPGEGRDRRSGRLRYRAAATRPAGTAGGSETRLGRSPPPAAQGVKQGWAAVTRVILNATG